MYIYLFIQSFLDTLICYITFYYITEDACRGPSPHPINVCMVCASGFEHHAAEAGAETKAEADFFANLQGAKMEPSSQRRQTSTTRTRKHSRRVENKEDEGRRGRAETRTNQGTRNH